MSSLADEVWSMFTVSEDDQPYIDPNDIDIFDHVVRKDGFDMTDEDEAALIPYGSKSFFCFVGCLVREKLRLKCVLVVSISCSCI